MYYYIVKRIKKKLIFGVSRKSGHNFYGRITVFGKGGGRRQKLRIIDNKRILSLKGIVLLVERDIKRTGFLGLIIYNVGILSYILLGDSLKVWDEIPGFIKKNQVFLNGSYFLSNIELGNKIYNIEIRPGQGAKYCRSAGVNAFLTSKDKKNAIIKMSSGWLIKVSKYCISILGRVSNLKHKFNVIGKAGKARIYGSRPKVRGVAMNPCDHPHGGGEGKKSQKAAPKTAYGKNTIAVPTIRNLIHLEKKKRFKKFQRKGKRKRKKR